MWNEELLEHVQIHDTGNAFKFVKLFLKHPVYIKSKIHTNPVRIKSEAGILRGRIHVTV
jgi:hypothetical protein